MTIAMTSPPDVDMAPPAPASRLLEARGALAHASHDFLGGEAVASLVPLVRNRPGTFAPLYRPRDSSGAPYASASVTDDNIAHPLRHLEPA